MSIRVIGNVVKNGDFLVQYIWGDSALLTATGNGNATGPWTTLQVAGVNELTGLMSPWILTPTNI